MTTIAEVRANLAQICTDNLAGFYGRPTVGDAITTGAIVVSRPPFDPRMVLGGGKAEHTFRLSAYIGRAASEITEARLNELAELSGDSSLIAAVQNGDNWTVTVDYAQVTLVGEVAITTFGTDLVTEYLVLPFDVEVVW